jgi:hypothetical protein
MIRQSQSDALLSWYDGTIEQLTAELNEPRYRRREVDGNYLTDSGIELSNRIDRLMAERDDLELIEIVGAPAALPNRRTCNVVNAVGVIGVLFATVLFAFCFLFENSELSW